MVGRNEISLEKENWIGYLEGRGTRTAANVQILSMQEFPTSSRQQSSGVDFGEWLSWTITWLCIFPVAVGLLPFFRPKIELTNVTRWHANAPSEGATSRHLPWNLPAEGRRFTTNTLLYNIIKYYTYSQTERIPRKKNRVHEHAQTKLLLNTWPRK